MNNNIKFDSLSYATDGMISRLIEKTSYDPNDYKGIIITMVGQGVISKPVGVHIVRKNHIFELEASSTKYYKFVRWIGDYEKEDYNKFRQIITKNMQLTAVFEKVRGAGPYLESNNFEGVEKYVVVYATNTGEGMLSVPDKNIILKGGSLEITAIDNNNYEFFAWNNGSTDRTITLENIQENINITAIFARYEKEPTYFKPSVSILGRR